MILNENKKYIEKFKKSGELILDNYISLFKLDNYIEDCEVFCLTLDDFKDKYKKYIFGEQYVKFSISISDFKEASKEINRINRILNINNIVKKSKINKYIRYCPSGATISKGETTLRNEIKQNIIHKNKYEIYISNALFIKSNVYILVFAIKFDQRVSYNNFIKNDLNKCIHVLNTDILNNDNKIQNYLSNQVYYSKENWSEYVNQLFVEFHEDVVDYYYFIDNLAQMKYENSNNNGSLVICKDKPTLIMELPNHCNLFGTDKMVRKLIEMAKDGSILVIYDKEIIGFTKKKYLVKSYVLVNYNINHADWKIQCNLGNILWSADVKNSIPKMSKKATPFFNYYRNKFNEIFGNGSFTNIHKKIIKSAINEKHGTMLVFLEDAVSEVNRLSSVGFPVKINENELELCIRSITSIDGAVIIDKSGKIEAIGIILDGTANEDSELDISRGARYNSAIKYTTNKQKCIVLVVSEDGYIDLISNGKKLKRRKKH